MTGPVCAVMCVLSSHLIWTSRIMDVPAGVTQDFSPPSSCGSCLMLFQEKVVVFTIKIVLTSIQDLLFLALQGKETNLRGHKVTQNKVQSTEKRKS